MFKPSKPHPVVLVGLVIASVTVIFALFTAYFIARPSEADYSEPLKFEPPLAQLLSAFEARSDNELAVIKLSPSPCKDFVGECLGNTDAVVRQVADDVLTRRHFKVLEEATRRNADSAYRSSITNVVSMTVAFLSLLLSGYGLVKKAAPASTRADEDHFDS